MLLGVPENTPEDQLAWVLRTRLQEKNEALAQAARYLLAEPTVRDLDLWNARYMKEN